MFIEVYVNNQKITVQKNSTILEACDKIGIEIPRFCFHRFLSIAGNCRMCLVEVDKVPKPLAACATPATNNMKILTETPFVKKARENVLEFLLQNHPLDCPVCDQGGECDLQDMTLNFGSDTSRFSNKKRGVENKKIGLIVKTIMTRCIHCTRCVRFATEVADVPTMGTSNRGQQTEIGFYVSRTFKSELSGNLVELCPVGALTSKKYAFSTRSWQIKKKNSIDLSDSMGSSIFYDLRGNEIVKVSPFTNDSINEEFISDKARLLYIFGQNFKSFILRQEKTKMLKLSRFYSQYFLYFVLSPIYLGLERLNDLKNYSYFFNYQVPSLQKNYQLNTCFSKNYKLNFSLADISRSDFCFLVNTNPRFESNLLYTRLKRHFKSNPSKESITSFGGSVGRKFYGVSPVSFLNIVEGKHSVCKKLKKSKKPLFIFGVNLVERFDNIFYWSFFDFLKKNINLVQKNWFGFGLLNFTSNFVGSNEIGLLPMNQNKANLSSSFYFVGLEYFGSFGILKLKPSKLISFFSEYIYENFYRFNLKQVASLSEYPNVHYLEKNETFINMEGKKQKTKKIRNVTEHLEVTENFWGLVPKLEILGPSDSPFWYFSQQYLILGYRKNFGNEKFNMKSPSFFFEDNTLFRVTFREKSYYRVVKHLKSRFVNDTFFSLRLGDEKYNKVIKKIEKWASSENFLFSKNSNNYIEKTVFKNNKYYYLLNTSKGFKSNLVTNQNNFYKNNLQEKSSVILNKYFDQYKRGSHNFDASPFL